MKHVFIINPAAGKSDITEQLRSRIERECAGLDYEIYRTHGPGDAIEFIRGLCEASREDMRFYACGGDGTLNEVVNGAAGFKHASVTCYPCGSGNDFVKYYGGKERFLDISALTRSQDKLIDIMEAEGRYCINVCNFGFDTAVAQTISGLKTKPFMGGKNAYYAGVVKALATSMKNSCTVKADGKELHSGDFLLCTVANGNYVGSSFKCAPRSKNNDGLLEVCLVKPISRMKFLSLVGAYTRGEHLDDPRFDDCIVYCRASDIEISSDMPGFACTLDGEVIETPHLNVRTLKQALRFAVPGGETE